MKMNGTKQATTIVGSAVKVLACFVIAVSMPSVVQPAHAQTETVLYSFQPQPDGNIPRASLTMDTKGNLYGTTYQGGANGVGTVFEVTSAGEESVLYSFGTGSADGTYPEGALILYKGDLYGTTYGGGGVSGPYCSSCGTVFKLSPEPKNRCASGTNTGNGWCETVLYSFGSGLADGFGSTAGLIKDKEGNLYGTTQYGGESVAGTVFELSPEPADGCPTGSYTGNGWCETVLYAFSGEPPDGQNPLGGVIMDKNGNLYGTTGYGGSSTTPGGTVFKLTPEPAGGCAAGSNTGNGWCETILYNFGSQTGDGALPYGGVVLDGKGNLYGTTSRALPGAEGGGTAFEVTPTGEETVLWTFALIEYDGCTPFAGVIRDSKGNLYGTTYLCGRYGLGTVFELSPPAKKGEAWTETILHSFQGFNTDGGNPAASLLMDSKSNLYGTTEDGGTNSDGDPGTVFEVTP